MNLEGCPVPPGTRAPHPKRYRITVRRGGGLAMATAEFGALADSEAAVVVLQLLGHEVIRLWTEGTRS